MSTDYHTEIATGAVANAATINVPLGQLDEAIGTIAGTPYFMAAKNAGQSVATASAVLVTWLTEVADSDGCFASSRFTPDSAGLFLITGQVFVSSTVSYDKYFRLMIYKNGAYANGHTSRGLSTSRSIQIAALVEANGTTDYFEIYVYHDAGIAVTVGSTIYAESTFQGFRVNAA